jgi:uncharacterized protein (TIGR03067 family)
MRTMSLMILMGGWSLAAEQEGNKQAMTDEAKLQGTWVLVSGERHGEAFSDETLKSVKLTFAGDVLITQNKDRANEAKFQLHADQTPKAIDLLMKDAVGQGIYELQGDDLKILHGEVGDGRPTKFDVKLSPRLTLLVLKREVARK